MNARQVMETAKSWVVIGVTADPEKYGYKIYKRLKQLELTVYGISPKYKELEGDVLYDNISKIPDGMEVAVFVVNPKIGVDYVKECFDKGIKTIWLQPGTVSFEVLQEAKNYGLDVIQSCVLVESRHIS